MASFLYILRLRSGNLYVGSTTTLERRWQEHVSGHACRTTKMDPPFAIVYREPFPTFAEARSREAQIKRWSRTKKEALICGDLEKLRLLSKRKKK